MLTYKNSPNLIAAQGKLRSNASYQVTVTGKTSQGHSSIGTYSFVTNSPPTGGTCKADKRQGKSLETVFVISCIGWQDDDLPLKYQFSYSSGDGIEIIFQFGNSSSAKGKLPVGELDIRILVIDALGSLVGMRIPIKVSVTRGFIFLHLNFLFNSQNCYTIDI